MRTFLRKLSVHFVTLLVAVPFSAAVSQAQTLNELKKKVNKTAKEVERSVDHAKAVVDEEALKHDLKHDLKQDVKQVVNAVEDLASYLKRMDFEEEPTFIEDGVACIIHKNGVKLTRSDINLKNLGNSVQEVQFSVGDAASHNDYFVFFRVTNLDNLKAEIDQQVVNFNTSRAVASEEIGPLNDRLQIKSKCLIIPKNIKDCVE